METNSQEVIGRSISLTKLLQSRRQQTTESQSHRSEHDVQHHYQLTQITIILD